MIEKSLRISRLVDGERSAGAGQALSIMGRSMKKQGMYEEALARVEEAQSILQETCGPEHHDVGLILSEKASIFTTLRLFDKALETYQQALAIVRRNHGADSE